LRVPESWRARKVRLSRSLEGWSIGGGGPTKVATAGGGGEGTDRNTNDARVVGIRKKKGGRKKKFVGKPQPTLF
jgi:hypothetical protein